MVDLELGAWSDAQRRAILAEGHDVIVSAGAGSGKTSVLVERVVRCVANGTPVDRVLVATFTEAAAAEMRKRIANRLQRLYKKTSSNGQHDAARYLAKQIAGLELAQISTLHSFCLEIVRRNFLALGMDPAFAIVDEKDAAVMRHDLVMELLEQHLQEASPTFIKMLEQFGAADPNQLAPLIYQLDIFSQSQPDPQGCLRQIANDYAVESGSAFTSLRWAETFQRWVRRNLEDALQLLRQAQRLASTYEELTSYSVHLTELVAKVEDTLLSSSDVSDLGQFSANLRAALEGKSPRAPEHPMKKPVQDKRKKAIGQIETIAEILGRGSDALVDDVIRLAPSVVELTQLVIEFQERFAERKRQRQVVDFGDLEHLALAALLDPATGEADRLREKFVEIFVDEYQDTSPIQDALVFAIARTHGNVFMVGDVKQSIYRFRMAEPNLFLEKYHSLGSVRDGEVIDLSDNYRSRPEVVHAVNYVFSHLFSLDFGGLAYDDRARMNPGAAYSPAEVETTLGGPVELHLLERAPVGDKELGDTDTSSSDTHVEAPNVEPDSMVSRVDVSDALAVGTEGTEEVPNAEELSAAEKEALVIARRIQELMGLVPGHKRMNVWDKEMSTYRPLQYRDIVVLLRSVKGQMNTLLDVFEKMGIPAYGETSTGFYGSLEVQWLMSTLSVIDNPRREVELLTLLRSPLVGFTDPQLADIRLSKPGNFYEAIKHFGFEKDEQTEAELREKCRSFLKRLNDWRGLARRTSTEAVLRAIAKDTGFLDYTAGMPDGARRTANIELLLDLARAFDTRSIDGVFGFVAMSRATRAIAIDAGEARTLAESEDVVRLMTIHHSKGLEYPVVFVAGLGKALRRRGRDRLYGLHTKLGFGPVFQDAATDRAWRTVPSIAVAEANLVEEFAEEARILYVAFTRARERLILVGSVRKLGKVVERAVESIDATSPSLPFHAMMNAESYLDWLLPPVLRHVDGRSLLERLEDPDTKRQTRSTNVSDGDPARFRVVVWNTPDGESLPSLPGTTDSNGSRDLRSDRQDQWRERIAREISDLEKGIVPLVDMDVETAAAYAEVAASASAQVLPTFQGVPSKVSATDMRRLWVAKQAHSKKRDADRLRSRSTAEHLLSDPAFVQTGALSGSAHGTAFHTVMQHIDWYSTAPDAVIAQLDDLARSGILTPEQRAAVSAEDISDFLNSALGQRVRRARRVYREQPFFGRIDLGDRFVIAQGVIDCLAEEDDDRWLVVDYKTDNIEADDVADKSREYAAQIATYMQVVTQLAQGKPVEAYIYFVRPRMAVGMEAMDLSMVFEKS